MVNQAKAYTQTVVATAVAPTGDKPLDLDVMQPLLRELVVDATFDEPAMQMELDSARSIFKGNEIIQPNVMLNNLKYGQELKLNIRKDQNPFELFSKKTVSYTKIGTCHSQIARDCTIEPITTSPSFEYLTFKFDSEYSWGVLACAKNTDFWDEKFFTQQYLKSKRAEQFGREVDLWNKVVDGLIAAPAKTVHAGLSKVHATHYWANLGSVTASARKTVPEAVRYMRNSFAGINPIVAISEEFATEVIQSVESVNNLNFSNTIVDTYKAFEVPGYRMSEAVQRIFGFTDVKVLVLKNSPWLTVNNSGTLTSQYPLSNDDGTKQYVAIFDPRVAYQFSRPSFSLVVKPYDYNHLQKGIQEAELVGSGITFPQYGMVLEYDAYTYK